MSATGFTSAQSALAAARDGRRRAVAAARQAEQRLRGARRGGDRAAQSIAEASQAVAGARHSANSATATEAAALAAFAELADPRRAVVELPDSLPFVMLPVRLETRFMSAAGEGGGPQLWVRIYPDDC